MTEIFGFVFDEYVTNIYRLADYFSRENVTPLDELIRQVYIISLFASSLVTVILVIVASIEFFSNIRKYLTNIFDHFFKLIANLFKLVLLLIGAPLSIVITFFMSALLIPFLGALFVYPLAMVVVNYRDATTLYQILNYAYLSLVFQIICYLIAEFGMFLGKINYYLIGETSSEKTKPVSLFSECKNALIDLFSDTNIRNIVFKLGLLFAGYVVAVICLLPLCLCGIWNVIILPYAFIRFIFRRLVHS